MIFSLRVVQLKHANPNEREKKKYVKKESKRKYLKKKESQTDTRNATHRYCNKIINIYREMQRQHKHTGWKLSIFQGFFLCFHKIAQTKRINILNCIKSSLNHNRKKKLNTFLIAKHVHSLAYTQNIIYSRSFDMECVAYKLNIMRSANFAHGTEQNYRWLHLNSFEIAA